MIFLPRFRLLFGLPWFVLATAWGVQQPWPDADGDGVPDYQELEVGTDPRDANSRPRVALRHEGGDWWMEFSPFANLSRYAALSGLGENTPWVSSGWLSVQATGAGGGRLRLEAPPNGHRFYRLQVETGYLQVPSNYRFAHPGILLSAADLAYLRKQIANGDAFRVQALAKTVAAPNNVGKLTFVPEPFVDVNASFQASEAVGVNELQRSAHAAYAHALQWALTGDRRYADKAIEILDAWSSTLQSIHKGTNDSTGNQGLYCGWTGPVFCRAAEIIRYTFDGWSQAGLDRFTKMMREVFLPNVRDLVPTTAGNWELTYAEGVIAIAIFTDDVPLFNEGLRRLQDRLPLYFYLPTDGARPLVPTAWTDRTYPQWQLNSFANYQTPDGADTYWYRGANSPFANPFAYYSGQCQETCRDLVHAQMGMATAVNSMQMAYVQGIDLFLRFQTRMVTSMEFCAGLLLDYENGVPTPGDLCGGTLKDAGRRDRCWEIAYNHYHLRRGFDLPKTALLNQWQRSQAMEVPKLHMAFENLTHAELAE